MQSTEQRKLGQKVFGYAVVTALIAGIVLMVAARGKGSENWLLGLVGIALFGGSLLILHFQSKYRARRDPSYASQLAELTQRGQPQAQAIQRLNIARLKFLPVAIVIGLVVLWLRKSGVF